MSNTKTLITIEHKNIKMIYARLSKGNQPYVRVSTHDKEYNTLNVEVDEQGITFYENHIT